MPKLPEQQYRVNSQFNEDLAEVKTQLLLLGQALATLDRFTAQTFSRLQALGALGNAEDRLLAEYQKTMDLLRRQGLRISSPTEGGEKAYHVSCPACQAKIKVKVGLRPKRCDWCGYAFQEGE